MVGYTFSSHLCTRQETRLGNISACLWVWYQYYSLHHASPNRQKHSIGRALVQLKV
jgi:hypothetical protein